MTTPQGMLELAKRLENMACFQRENMSGTDRFNNFKNGILADEAAASLRQAAAPQGREAQFIKALKDVRNELWVDYCLRMGRTDTDPKPFDAKPHIRIINVALRPERSGGRGA